MSSIGTIVTIIGFLINIYLLYQVSRLNEAKQEEREFMQKILNIDKLDYILTTAATNLRNSDSVNIELTEDILRAQGQLEGALQAIDELEDNQLSDGSDYHVKHFDYYERGFLTDKIPTATDTVRIICFRNGRLNNYNVVEVLAERIKQDVTVELYSMSPTLPDEVLGRAGKNLPNPTEQGDSIREEIEQNFTDIYEIMDSELSDKKMNDFNYSFYEEFPKVHLVQIDDVIYLSLPHYTKGDLENVKYDGQELYPSMRVPVSSPVGQYVMANIEYLGENLCTPWTECIDFEAEQTPEAAQ